MSTIRLYKAGEGSRSVPSIDSPGWIANGWSTEPVQEPAMEPVEVEKLTEVKETVQVCPTGTCPMPSNESDPLPDPTPATEPESEPEVTEPTAKRRKR